MLKEMKFTHNFTWSYDPLGIISKKRPKNKSTPYIHTHRPEIEQFMNQPDWAKNTLQEAEEWVISFASIQTPMPQENNIIEVKEDKVKQKEEQAT